MCKRNLFYGVDCAGGILPSDLGFKLPGNQKAKPEVDILPPDLSAWIESIIRGHVPIEATNSPEKSEVKTFGEPIKLKNGKWGLKISRADAFVLLKPIRVLNSAGDEFRLYGFIRKSRKTSPFWFMNTGKWFNDDYFYIETEAPCTKMTLAEVEEKLGFKVEIIE